ncbi:MAG: hypothetical protein WCL21_05060 [Mariniphaga sp.]
MKNVILKSINAWLITLLLLSVSLSYSCKDKVYTLGAAPTDSQVIIEKSAGADANHWVLKNKSTTVGVAYWDLGNGASASGNEVTVFYPDVDTYKVVLTLAASGGMASTSITHSQTVADPKAGNLVKGGKFATAGDIAQWTIQRIGDNVNSTIVFANGWVTIDNTPWTWGQAAIYQPIQVVAGQKYKVDLKFKTDGVTNGWFKVYACTTQPVQLTEYGGPVLVAEIGVWGDWAVRGAPKAGLLSIINDPNSGLKSGCIVSFPSSGTIWLEIQVGAQELNDGISFTNVEFRGVQ